MELIKFNKATGSIEINLDSIFYVTEIREVVKRKGQVVLNERRINFIKEIEYIFYMADWSDNNQFVNLSDKERNLAAKEACELPVKWEADELIKRAVDKYIKIQQDYSPTAKALIALKRGLRNTALYYENLGKQVERHNDTLVKLNLEATSAQPDALDQIITQEELLNTVLANASKVLLEAPAKLEKALSEIESLENRMRTEQQKKIEVVGGGNPYNRE